MCQLMPEVWRNWNSGVWLHSLSVLISLISYIYSYFGLNLLCRLILPKPVHCSKAGAAGNISPEPHIQEAPKSWWFVVIARRKNTSKFAITQLYSCAVLRWLIVLSCRVIAHGFFNEAKQRRSWLVRGWVTLTDQRLSHAWFLRENTETGDIDLWMTMNDPMTFVTWDTLILPSMVTEGWIFYASGLAIMSVGLMGRRMTGATGAPGQLVDYYLCR